MFGVQLWIWIAVGASSAVVLGIIILIVLVQRRNKRMKVRQKDIKKMKEKGEMKERFICFISSVEASETTKINETTSYSQRLLPMSQVLAYLLFLFNSQMICIFHI